jgi:uncharacterized protein DUF4145
MADSFSWTCPYCGRAATITESNTTSFSELFTLGNKDGTLGIRTTVIVCPRDKCREYTLTCSLHKTHRGSGGGTLLDNPAILNWKLKPESTAKSFPDYIPLPIRTDYEEACKIAGLSPKASATLSRRCLQGIIRDFWKISKSRLFDEIKELENNIDQPTWEAIDAVRKLGNIGAHMEQNINLIVDVDPEEADLLIKLIEELLTDWYIRRHEREDRMRKVVAAAVSKTTQKQPQNP